MVNTQRPSRGTGVWRWRRRDPAAARPRARVPRGAGARRGLRHRPEDPPRAAAARTDQDLDREHAVQEPGPRPQSWRARAGVHARVVRCGRDDRRLQRARGASRPWYASNGRRGGGTRVANRSNSSSGSTRSAVEPSRQEGSTTPPSEHAPRSGPSDAGSAPRRPAERGPHDRRQCPSHPGPARGPK
jgi:hypothetical protein